MSYATEARQRSSRSPTDSTNNIPIPNSSPRHQNHHHPADRSSDSGRPLVSPSASRSPQPSLSSYRAHPYPPRRHSVSAAQAASNHEDASRIYLPPPNSAAPLHVPHERRDPRDREQRNLDVRDSPQSMWHDRRPSLPRTQSERYHSHNDRGYHLPSFASLSSASSGGPVTPTSAPGGSMGPPPAALSPGLPSAALSPGGSRATSPKPYSPFGGGGLRPSYSYEGPSGSSGSAPPAAGGRGHSLGLTIGGSGSGANSTYRPDQSPTQNHPGSDRTSPPLHAMNGYSHDQYMSPPHSNHSYSSLHAGRARSHSAASALSRYGPNGAMSDNGDWASAQTPQTPVASGGSPGPGSGGGGGQNRRVAHLLSEQKRRESINNGFNQLRSALPDIISTDSKAVVLRKAVSYIGYLEDSLRQAGIAFGSTPASNPTGVPPPPALVRGDSGSVQGDEEENEEEEEDVQMRDTTSGVATLKVGQVPANNKFRVASQAEWEHVENINGKA